MFVKFEKHVWEEEGIKAICAIFETPSLEYAIMQGPPDDPYPERRILWGRERHGIKEHIAANIRIDGKEWVWMLAGAVALDGYVGCTMYMMSDDGKIIDEVVAK